MRRAIASGIASIVVALVASVPGAAPAPADTTAPQELVAAMPGPGETVHVKVRHLVVDRPGGKVRERVSIRLGAPAEVSLGIHDRSGSLVRGDVRLGPLRRGQHFWTWSGRKNNGTPAPDGRYDVRVSVRFKKSGALAGRVRPAIAHRRYHSGNVTSSHPTIYPRSTDVHDTTVLENRPLMWTRPSLRIRNSAGKVVFTRAYGRLRPSLHLAWGGRDNRGRVLPAGTYKVTVSGVDRDGFTGATKALAVKVSGQKLVTRTRAVTLSPTGSRAIDYPRGCNGCADYQPCGTPVASDRFAQPGALSYRSGPGCPAGWKGPWAARSTHELVPHDDAPRGYGDVTVSMFGGPTTPGAADQGELLVYGTTTTQTPHGETITAGSPTTTGTGPETSDHTTTAGIVAMDVLYDDQGHEPPVPGLRWQFWARNGASYDVASFTVTYTFLTPQS